MKNFESTETKKRILALSKKLFMKLLEKPIEEPFEEPFGKLPGAKEFALGLSLFFIAVCRFAMLGILSSRDIGERFIAVLLCCICLISSIIFFVFYYKRRNKTSL